MFAHPVLLQFERGMVAALPVQDHLDVLGFNAHDDFAQGRTTASVSRTWRRDATRRVRGRRRAASAAPAPARPAAPASLPRRRRSRPRSRARPATPRSTAARVRRPPDDLSDPQHRVAGAHVRLRSTPAATPVQLPPGSRRLARPGIERPDRRIDAERLQDPQHLSADSLIGAQAAKRDAALGAVVHESAFAMIAPRLAAIGHVHLRPQWPQRRRPARSNSPCRAAPLATALPLPVALLAITRWFVSNSAQQM